MKNLVRLIATSALFVSGYAVSQNIDGTAHDLTDTNTGDGGRICVYCHTPHNGSTTLTPLWNHTESAASYTMYDAAFSSTIDMTVAGEPQASSAACLSCHDGTVALDSIINVPQAVTWAALGSPMAASANGYLGTTLTSDHPISVTYDPAQDGDFVALNTVRGSANVRLFGGSNDQVECGSCHDPHDNSNVPFLRSSNDNSALCLTCHSK